MGGAASGPRKSLLAVGLVALSLGGAHVCSHTNRSHKSCATLFLLRRFFPCRGASSVSGLHHDRLNRPSNCGV